MAFSDNIDHDGIHDIPSGPFASTDMSHPTFSVIRESLPVAISA